MGKWDVRFIGGNYDFDTIDLRLYGRTRKGESITVVYKDFRPYFYVYASRKEVEKILGNDSEVQEISEKMLYVSGDDLECTRITLTQPRNVKSYRKRFQEQGFAVFAADIPFHHRFIYDKDIGACATVAGKKVSPGPYTTELVVEASDFSDCEPFIPPLTIFSFDIENSISMGNILTICCAIRKNGKITSERFLGAEVEIIQAWVDSILRHDPDIITGYNIDGYDIPYILDRAKLNRMESFPLGRDGSALKQVSERFWRLPGRVIADAWWNVKREIRPKKESLNAVSALLLGEAKHDVDPKKIDSEWESDREKVVEYCFQDARLALLLLEKIEVIKKYLDLGVVSKLPLDDVINGRTSQFIDSVLIREADRRGVGVPLTRHVYKTDKIEGGYVHEIRAGIYPWVIVLDFKAMYPSIIIANNICFTTLDPKGEIESPVSGVAYLSPEKREGLLPTVLKRLMDDRDECKKKMREAKTEDERHYYDGLQAAIKILMNAVYGVFASSFYRFTNQKIGESITAYARANTKEVITRLESEGMEVIYGDTDSVFFASPEKEMEAATKLGKDIASRFSKGGAILEFEKILNPLFSHGKKKRYIGKIIWPEEGRIVRGYETRRSDAFDLQSEALEAVFDEVLGEEPEKAVQISKDLVEKTKAGKIPIEKLVISRTVKDLGGARSAYKNPDRMANVQAAKKLVEMGYEFMPGMKTSWIVTDSNRVPQQVEPYMDGRKFEYTPDWDYYAGRVASTVSRVTEYFGWSDKALLTGRRQVSLFGDFGTKDEKNDTGSGGDSDSPVNKEDRAEPRIKSELPTQPDKEKKGKMTLEDFC